MDTAAKDEKLKNIQEPHEGFGDGDDDDPDDRLELVMLTMSLAGDLMAACASARAHGIDFDDIRQAFDTQLAQLVQAEKTLAAVANGMSVDDALDAVHSATKKRIDMVMGAAPPDADKKSS